MQLKDAIVLLLQSGIGVDMLSDLACYPAGDGSYHVEYSITDEVIKLKNLSQKHLRLLEKDQEFLEIFANPEEAAEFFLEIRPEDRTESNSQRKSLGETLVMNEKNSYFE